MASVPVEHLDAWIRFTVYDEDAVVAADSDSGEHSHFASIRSAAPTGNAFIEVWCGAQRHELSPMFGVAVLDERPQARSFQNQTEATSRSGMPFLASKD